LLTVADRCGPLLRGRVGEPIDAGGDYSNVELVQDGPPIAHAVAPGTSTPECGTAVRVLLHGFPWKAPVPAHWQRCPECLRMHPV
jgi:hypothetical protein